MVTFVETRLFTRLVQEYLTDGQYAELQRALIENPEAGSVIRGSGGVRMYPKSVADSIPAHALKQIREELDDE